MHQVFLPTETSQEDFFLRPKTQMQVTQSDKHQNISGNWKAEG